MDNENFNAETNADALSERETRPVSTAHHHHNSSHSSHHHHSSSSHHSSSGHSSHGKKKKKKRKSKNERYAILRTIFSFLLFLCISATAVFSAMGITVLNENRVSQIFTNDEYLSALHSDVLEYSQDLCLKYGIPDDCVKEAVTYDSISNIQIAYTYGQLDMDEMYTASTYTDYIKYLNDELVSSTEKSVKANALEIEESKKDDAIKKFAGEITDYVTQKVEFRYISDLQSIFNVSTTVLIIGIVLFAVLGIAFLLLTISFKDKEYRALRSVSYSIFAAAGLNLLLVIFVGVVSVFKDFLIYPLYFCDSVMSYINSCVLTFLFSSITLFIIGTMVSALVWRLKRNNE